jgi:hypothetical protein
VGRSARAVLCEPVVAEVRASRSVVGAKRLLAFALVCAVVGAAAPSAEAARYCGRVVNPYPDTRYEGTDLTRVWRGT